MLFECLWQTFFDLVAFIHYVVALVTQLPLFMKGLLRDYYYTNESYKKP